MRIALCTITLALLIFHDGRSVVGVTINLEIVYVGESPMNRDSVFNPDVFTELFLPPTQINLANLLMAEEYKCSILGENVKNAKTCELKNKWIKEKYRNNVMVKQLGEYDRELQKFYKEKEQSDKAFIIEICDDSSRADISKDVEKFFTSNDMEVVQLKESEQTAQGIFLFEIVQPANKNEAWKKFLSLRHKMINKLNVPVNVWVPSFLKMFDSVQIQPQVIAKTQPPKRRKAENNPPSSSAAFGSGKPQPAELHSIDKATNRLLNARKAANKNPPSSSDSSESESLASGPVGSKTPKTGLLASMDNSPNPLAMERTANPPSKSGPVGSNTPKTGLLASMDSGPFGFNKPKTGSLASMDKTTSTLANMGLGKDNPPSDSPESESLANKKQNKCCSTSMCRCS